MQNAEEKLERYFSDGGWELYDGVPSAHDAEITVCDIVLSVTLNSRLDTRREVWRVWKEKAAIQEALGRISAQASLEDEVIPWDDLHGLFQAFCKIDKVGGAKATKVLHKKRPALIPIYDSIMGSHYERRMRQMKTWKLPWGQFLIDYTHLFREDLMANQIQLHALCDDMAARGWPITPVRAMEVLIWIENEPSGEYREG